MLDLLFLFQGSILNGSENGRKGKYHDRQYLYLVGFVSILEAHFSEIPEHILQRENDDGCFLKLFCLWPLFKGTNSFLPGTSQISGCKWNDSFPRHPKCPSSFSFSYSFPSKGITQHLGNTRTVFCLLFICTFSFMLNVPVLSVLNLSRLLCSAFNYFLPVYLQK